VTVSGEGTVLSTTDGGSNWHVQALPVGIAILYAVACSTGSECIAFGLASSGGAVIVATAPAGSRTDTVS
jgi:photosystem II stability/assembly factor-like uncharacterized protein